MSATRLTPGAALRAHRGELRRVLKSFGVQRAGYFGSTARGTDVVGSDLDIIVEFYADVTPDLFGLSASLSEAAGVPVDVVEASAVYAAAEKTGIGTTILRDTLPL